MPLHPRLFCHRCPRRDQDVKHYNAGFKILHFGRSQIYCGMERMSYPWSEPVEADSDKEAEETCQEIADEYDVDLIDVEERSKNWWDCIFS